MKDLDWEGPLIAILFLVVFGLLMAGADRAVGADLGYVPPTHAEANCINYVATLTVFVVAPAGTPEEQQAKEAIIRSNLGEMTYQAVSLLRAGELASNVMPWAYRKCIQLTTANDGSVL